MVAIDGHGASGKSTIAAGVSHRLGATVVHTDDFFADLLRAQRQSLSPAAGVVPYYDLERLRREALEPLLDRRSSRFAVFDWERGQGLAGQSEVAPTDVVVLEGVGSASPPLADLVDFAVLVQTPEPERVGRLRRRVAPEDWDSRWLAAERVYFETIRTPPSFDLVVGGDTASARPGKMTGSIDAIDPVV